MARPTRRPGPHKREATPEEFKAMAHPLRLRILRLCLHDSLTNKEIADRLGKDPATVLYHVRMLVRTGFLEAEPVRAGANGALEKPYRATRKSWDLSADKFPADQRLRSQLAMVDALRDELADSGPDSMIEGARMGLQLSPDAMAELSARIADLIQELADRPDDKQGDRFGLFITLHRRP